MMNKVEIMKSGIRNLELPKGFVLDSRFQIKKFQINELFILL